MTNATFPSNWSCARAEELSEAAWNDVIDVNLTGTWLTAKAAIPHLRAAGGGSIVIISSLAGLRGVPNSIHYNASKFGLVGVTVTLASELGPHSIRVNCVHPGNVDTPMIQHQVMYDLFIPDLPPEQRTRAGMQERAAFFNLLPIPWADAGDISNAVLWLASDEARYITGISLPIDAGASQKQV